MIRPVSSPKRFPRAKLAQHGAVFHELVVAASERQRGPALLRRNLGDQIDGAADRVGIHVGRDRFGDLDRLQQVGRDDVERDTAPITPPVKVSARR